MEARTIHHGATNTHTQTSSLWVRRASVDIPSKEEYLTYTSRCFFELMRCLSSLANGLFQLSRAVMNLSLCVRFIFRPHRPSCHSIVWFFAKSDSRNIHGTHNVDVVLQSRTSNGARQCKPDFAPRQFRAEDSGFDGWFEERITSDSISRRHSKARILGRNANHYVKTRHRAQINWDERELYQRFDGELLTLVNNLAKWRRSRNYKPNMSQSTRL